MLSARKQAARVVRNSAGRTPRSSSQSTSGGPLTLSEVVSSPVANPAPSVSPRRGRRGGASRDRV